MDRRHMLWVVRLLCVAAVVVCSCSAPLFAQSPSADVPHVIRYNGTLTNLDGSPRVGTVGVTFSIYSDQTSTAPLYLEVQNVVADQTGHYAVLLGAARAEGLPSALFTTNDARWLGIRVENEPEQPRVLLAAVPYAMKAADAETLGGKPLSAFMLHDKSTKASEQNPATTVTAIAGTVLHPNLIGDSTGTAGRLAVWKDATTLESTELSHAGGYLGIGTGTPQSPVHIFSPSPVFRIQRSTGTANAVMTFSWEGADKADFGVPGANDNFVNGSLAGDFALRNFGGNMLFSTDSGAHAQLYLKNGGNVGIGTVTPTEALDVTGNIKASGTISASNLSATGTTIFTGAPSGTGVDQGSVYIDPATATANQTLFGVGVGATQKMLLDAEGDLTTAGVVSGTAFNIGSNLFAFGSYTGQRAFLGFAGNQASTGASNLAAGYQALNAVTTGYNNVALGSFALLGLTTGAGNTAAGWGALRAHTTANANTAFGYGTLYLNTTGADNTAVGNDALHDNLIGAGNTAAGSLAAFSTTGNNNTASGYRALYYNTSGAENTALGAYATTGATLNNATAIGARAMVLQNDSLVLGSINGMNGATASTKVGIGTSYPSYPLDVEATNTAVFASSTDGYGLSGRSTNNNGIFGTTETASRAGVYGTSNVGYGVFGISASSYAGVAAQNVSAGGGVALDAYSLASHGLFANSESASHAGVYGYNHSGGNGVHGDSTSGSAVYGESSSGYGVRGKSTSSHGVYGESSANHGIYGSTTGPQGSAGVFGTSDAQIGVRGHTNTGYGVYGESEASGKAGYFAGDVHVAGTLSKASGSFKIDHPLDPANKYLSHSFVESPDMMNVYNGNIVTDNSGLATVTMPDWFGALNRDFRYQLTVIGQFAQAIVAEEIKNNRFIVKTDKPNVKVSWQVTGIRKDAWANGHRIQVEEQKPAKEIGMYLYPQGFGQAADKVIGRSPAEPAKPRPASN